MHISLVTLICPRISLITWLCHHILDPHHSILSPLTTALSQFDSYKSSSSSYFLVSSCLYDSHYAFIEFWSQCLSCQYYNLILILFLLVGILLVALKLTSHNKNWLKCKNILERNLSTWNCLLMPCKTRSTHILSLPWKADTRPNGSLPTDLWQFQVFLQVSCNAAGKLKPFNPF